jgi:hypothetical protein
MMLKPRTRLHKLCRHALGETDPEKLPVLLKAIEEILSETVAEYSAMLKEVAQVLEKREQSSRINLT